MRVRPEDANALTGLAATDLALGRHDDAIASFERACRIYKEVRVR